MARTNQRNSKNNNPQGRNQYSGGVMDIARDRPVTAAIGAAAAVGAGVFLWSRRNQISNQISNLSEQIGEWTEDRRSTSTDDFTSGATGTEAFAGTDGASARKGRSSRKSQSQFAEEALSLKQTGETI